MDRCHVRKLSSARRRWREIPPPYLRAYIQVASEEASAPSPPQWRSATNPSQDCLTDPQRPGYLPLVPNVCTRLGFTLRTLAFFTMKTAQVERRKRFVARGASATALLRSTSADALLRLDCYRRHLRKRRIRIPYPPDCGWRKRTKTVSISSCPLIPISLSTPSPIVHMRRPRGHGVHGRTDYATFGALRKVDSRPTKEMT